MRPESYHEQEPEKRCGNCRHYAFVRWQEDDLCFSGDSSAHIVRCDDEKGDLVQFDSRYLEIFQPEEYSDVWSERVVDSNGVCDNWEAREKGEEQHGG